MSESTWSEVLSDSQRQHLRQFLPQFPNTNVAEQDSTVRDLFNNRDFNFGNPLHLAQKLFRGASQLTTHMLSCPASAHRDRDSLFLSQPRWLLQSRGGQVQTAVRQVPEEATAVLPSAVLPQIVEADPRLQKGIFVLSFICKMRDARSQVILMCLLVVGAAGVRSSQRPGLSTQKKATVQNSC